MGGVGTLNAHGITDDNFHYTEKGENEESLATHVIKYKKDKLNQLNMKLSQDVSHLIPDLEKTIQQQ